MKRVSPYELSNHLGNVLTVISDRKIPVDANNDFITDYYLPDVISSTDYYAFGSPMPGRQFNSGNYRFGFNGKEKDDELKGNGNSYDFGDRIYDPRIGNWLSIDPLFGKYPAFSPYSFAADNPILFVDRDGREIWISFQDNRVKGADGKPFLQKVQYKNGELYNADGSKYTRSNSYLIAVKNHLNGIKESHPDNTKMISELETSRDKHEIANSAERVKERGIQFSKNLGEANYDIGMEVKYDANYKVVETFENNTITYLPDPYTVDDNDPTGDPTGLLAHELKHAYDKQTGKMKSLKAMGYTKNGVAYSEVSAVAAENKVRNSKHKPLRTNYDVKGGKEGKITNDDFKKVEK